MLEVPNLIQSQLQSWEWFKADGLQEVYKEISPIADYTGKTYELEFLEHYFREPKYSPLDNCDPASSAMSAISRGASS